MQYVQCTLVLLGDAYAAGGMTICAARWQLAYVWYRDIEKKNTTHLHFDQQESNHFPVQRVGKLNLRCRDIACTGEARRTDTSSWVSLEMAGYIRYFLCHQPSIENTSSFRRQLIFHHKMTESISRSPRYTEIRGATKRT